MTNRALLFAAASLVAAPDAAFAQIGGGICDDSYRLAPGQFEIPYEEEDGTTSSQILSGEIVVVGSLNNARTECTETKIELPQSDAYGATGRVEQSLSLVAGLQQFRRADGRSANPTSQGVTLRGLGGNAASRALIFIDDVPQADPFGGWVAWPGLDAVNLRGARIRKGAGQASAGPGALAGVIELESVQRLQRREDSVTIGYGSRNSIEARGRYLEWLGNGTLSLSGSYARGDGFVPIIERQRGAVDRAAPYEQAGLALRLWVPVNEDTDLQANLRGFTDERDRGVDFSNNSNSGVDASVRLVGQGDWKYSVTAYAQLREFSSEFGAVSADRSTVTATLDQFATPSTGLGLRFEVRPPLGDDFELRTGGEWRRTQGETRENFTFVAGLPTRLRTAGGQTETLGAFVEGAWNASYNFILSASGRLDRWEISDGFRREVNIGGAVRSDDRFTNRSGTEATARLGAALTLSDDWRLKASAYTGWRLPTLNELYRPFRVGTDATAANELLSPERIKGVEASLSFGQDLDKRADLTLFYNRLNDAIANVSLGQGPGTFPGVGFVAAGGTYRQRANLEAIVSKGLELDARLRLSYDAGVRLAYSYVDAQVRGKGVSLALDGLRPAQVPQHSANISLEYLPEQSGWQSVATLRYTAGQFEDDANSRRLKSALTADAMLYYRFESGLALELRGENLFNARVEAAISSAGIIERANPRTIWLGLRWNFN
jgi:vitamin B12 transporter